MRPRELPQSNSPGRSVNADQYNIWLILHIGRLWCPSLPEAGQAAVPVQVPFRQRSALFAQSAKCRHYLSSVQQLQCCLLSRCGTPAIAAKSFRMCWTRCVGWQLHASVRSLQPAAPPEAAASPGCRPCTRWRHWQAGHRWPALTTRPYAAGHSQQSPLSAALCSIGSSSTPQWSACMPCGMRWWSS